MEAMQGIQTRPSSEIVAEILKDDTSDVPAI